MYIYIIAGAHGPCVVVFGSYAAFYSNGDIMSQPALIPARLLILMM